MHINASKPKIIFRAKCKEKEKYEMPNILIANIVFLRLYSLIIRFPPLSIQC